MPRPPSQVTELSRWMIETSTTTTNLARELRVTRQAINVWRRGQGFPRISIARKLISISENKLTLNEIYASSTPAKKNKGLRNAK